MPYTVTPTSLPEVLLLTPKVYEDTRGFFFEAFNAKDFVSKTGIECEFVQDNHSRSTRGVLRGLHYQIEHAQGKLVRVVAGTVFDVAVDIRRASSNFGRWVGVPLSAENKQQLWIPKGFAHGFYVISEHAEFLYKTTDFWYPEYERTIAWNDPALNIGWPLDASPVLTAKDSAGKCLLEADVY